MRTDSTPKPCSRPEHTAKEEVCPRCEPESWAWESRVAFAEQYIRHGINERYFEQEDFEHMTQSQLVAFAEKAEDEAVMQAELVTHDHRDDPWDTELA